jgi:tRNA pseudouridine55 synthase
VALGLLWKAPGIGSQDALGRLKRDLGLPGKAREGIGHTGVLDPFAEGWLLCGTEEGTKLLAPLSGLDKTYEAQMLIGWTTATLDSTSEALHAEGLTAQALRDWLARDLSRLDAELREFLSHQIGASFDQIPPQFSAVHVDGKRAYDWARKGVEKELKPKRVHILEAAHLGTERGPENSILWSFRVRVSSGTYIRALARDWATELASYPGHLTSLVRRAVGDFGRGVEASAWTLLELSDLKGLFDIHYLTAHEADRLRQHGQWQPRPHARPCLLVGPGDSGVIAWTEALSGKLGRVFTADPLQ